jgi:8-oxo-dGTP pyrophosphatase MutT (NUDIX family)
MSDRLKAPGTPPFSTAGAPRDARPADSATVLLLRPAPEGGIPEVFLVRRHGKSAFMGGAWVFPGGKVDTADAEEAIRRRIAPGDAEACAKRLDETPGSPLTEAGAVALYVAAAREVFEEAGVLLARPRGATTWIRFDDEAVAERFARWRRRVHAGEVGFAELLEAEDLVLDLRRLVYVSHWITPSAEARRFDTRFFAVRIPEGQTPLHDHTETTASEWHAAAAALEAHAGGGVFIAPPTLRHLEELAAHDDIDAYLRAMDARAVGPLLPKLGLVDEAMAILLPWDPLYDSAEGEGLDLNGPHPMEKTGGPSRIVLEGERFVSRDG